MGTIVRNQGVVTLFDVQPGFAPPVGTGDTEPDQFDTASGATNFTADTSASGPFAPADPSGAVGPNNLVVFDSDLYQVFNKSTGTALQSSTLNTFWTNAGVSISTGDYVGQPHVVYDPATGRWYASALDQSIPPGSVGPAVIQNNVLLAVSKTSDPTQGWVGFEFRQPTRRMSAFAPTSIRSALTARRLSLRRICTTFRRAHSPTMLSCRFPRPTSRLPHRLSRGPRSCLHRRPFQRPQPRLSIRLSTMTPAETNSCWRNPAQDR